MYKSNDANTALESGPGSEFYFRIVYNGKDLTNRIHFCKTSTSVTSLQNDGRLGGIGRGGNSGKRKSSRVPVLCPIESIIRFLHDDYFTPFNVTNLKDACTNHI